MSTARAIGPRPGEPSGALALLTLLVAAGIVAAWQAGGSWLSLWVLLVAAPLAEEVVFRGGLQHALLATALAPWQANVATAAVFASLHALLHATVGGLATALPSLLLGLVYQRTGRIAPCVLLHAAMNGAWLLLPQWAPALGALRAALS
jgi:membrane protease YdiL (CAAX protease family)